MIILIRSISYDHDLRSIVYDHAITLLTMYSESSWRREQEKMDARPTCINDILNIFLNAQTPTSCIGIRPREQHDEAWTSFILLHSLGTIRFDQMCIFKTENNPRRSCFPTIDDTDDSSLSNRVELMGFV